MGRIVPDGWRISLLGAISIHLALSLVYGLVVSSAVVRATQWRAVLIGGLMGILLYMANFAICSLWEPELRGNELSVLLTHVVFGLIAGAAYRGLLRRRPVATVAVP